jgi:hypothetical protein
MQHKIRTIVQNLIIILKFFVSGINKKINRAKAINLNKEMPLCKARLGSNEKKLLKIQ